MFQPSPWRADFPAIAALQRQHQTYLDSAATTQKPKALLDALSHYYGHGAANVHRAQHLPGALATQAFETRRDKVAAWLNAADSRQIVFTHGATSALNLLAYGLEHRLEAGDEIAISALEHHANLLPWQQLAHRRNLRLVVLPLDAQGRIDQDQALQLIGPRTRVLAISQLSNVLGTWQPLPALLAHARAQGALTVVDGAQGVVHGRQDMQQLGCDFYVFSSHKLYGPDGVGVLYGRAQALELLRHWQFGGEMVQLAEYHSASFRPAPLGFEAGTPPIAGVIGLGASLRYLCSLDADAVANHDSVTDGDKIDAELKGEVETALAEAKTALEGDDTDAITAKAQALTDVAMKMGQAIYSQEQASASPAGEDAAASGESKADEDVVDAEFSEVDEDAKG